MMRRYLLGLLVLLMLSFPARGEEIPALGDLGRIVVSASRMAQHDYKIASNVSVIDAETIGEFTARTVNDILVQQMGVSVYNSGTPKTANVDIRGFGDTAGRNVLVLVNDRKVNSIDISGPDLLQIPVGAVERIEIIRGAGSVLYGDNAVGGVINVITKEGEGELSGKTGIALGSYDSVGGDVEVSGEWQGFNYYHYSKYSDEGGYRSNSDVLAKDFLTRLGYRLSDKFKVSLNTSWHEDDYGLPGGLTDAELKDLGRRGSADEDDFASTKDRFVQLTLDLLPWPGNINWGRFVLDTSYRNRDTYAMFSAYDFGTKREIDTLGLLGKYVFDQKIFNRNFNLVTGIDFYDVDNDIWGSGSNSDDITITKRELGFYLFAEAETLDGVYINAGTRRQRADYIFDQRSGSAHYDKERVEEWVHMVGSRYDYAHNSNMFFNVQQTFRFLATDEWYSTWTGLNTDLRQQSGIQYELGIKHNLNDVTLISMTPYWLSLRDEIFFDPTAGFGWGTNNNYGKTRRIGVEIRQDTDLLKWIDPGLFSKLKFSTTYTYQEPEFISGNNDHKRIPLAAEQQAELGIRMEVWEKYLAALSGRYVGSRYAINDTLNETPRLKPYTVFDLKLAYKPDPFEVYVEVNNIFNQKYFSYATKSTSSPAKDYFPAPERSFRFGMNVKF